MMEVLMYCKPLKKRVYVYGIRYKKQSGFPLFLIYDHNKGMWLWMSAKHFIPEDPNDMQNW